MTCAHRFVTWQGIQHVQAIAHPDTGASGDLEFVGTMIDVTERKRAEEALRRAQAELAHVTRVTTLGELAHEVNQPLAAIVADANASLNRLAAADPDLDMVREALNGMEAMASVGDRPRELMIRSRPHEGDRVLVAVQDAGVGIDPNSMDQVFSAFFTTKPGGMGMGLSISRSIIEAHGGRLWATAKAPHGAIFQFTLPIGGAAVP